MHQKIERVFDHHHHFTEGASLKSILKGVEAPVVVVGWVKVEQSYKKKFDDAQGTLTLRKLSDPFLQRR